MTRSRLIALLLTIGTVMVWLLVKRDRHPDTASVPPYAPYVELAATSHELVPGRQHPYFPPLFCRGCTAL